MVRHMRTTSVGITIIAVLYAILTIGCSSANKSTRQPQTDRSADTADTVDDDVGETITIRVATFNTSLSREARGQLADDLAGGEDPQARKVAEILQRVRPDIVLLNEFDWDEDRRAARLFDERYLSVAQGESSALDYPHRYVPKTNTGVHSGVDLNNDGRVDSTPGDEGYGNDAFGFGTFPGQYGMVIYSRFPVVGDEVRTFRRLLWKEMPDNLLPKDWYSDEAADALRLSSKNHVDVPFDVNGETLHLLASHPTPPSFDGDADRNGRRNHDEIRFWSDYISGGERAAYIRDDGKRSGGLGVDRPFVLVGDLNNDPKDGDGRKKAIRNLLGHPRIQDPRPTSRGAATAARDDGGKNTSHEGAPQLDTADFDDRRVGNLRVDYALPSAGLDVAETGVFWPDSGQDGADPSSVSDHRLVWVDITLATP